MEKNTVETIDIKQAIVALLKKSETISTQDPAAGEALARQALEIAEQQQWAYEICLSLLHIASARESAADNSTDTETYLQKAIAIATENDFTEQLVTAYSKLASVMNAGNRMEQAAEYMAKAQYHLSQLISPHPELVLQILYDDLNIRYRRGEVASSLLADCLHGLERSTAMKNEGLQTCFLQMLIMLSAAAGELEAALKYSKQFLAIEEGRGFHMNLMGAYVFQSGLYEKTGQIVESENSLGKAMAAAEKLGDERSYFLVALRRAQFLLNHHRYAEAKSICEEIVLLPTAREMPKQYYGLMVCMAKIAEAEHRLADAVLLMEKERKLFTEDKVVLHQLTGYLHELYAKCNDYPAAYAALVENQKIAKEIYAAEKAKEYAELHARYETKEKEVQLRETRLQKLDAELKAIKSQMNPHFAFNALKTIDYLLEQNKVLEARKSLNAFAQLMRATLEQSSNELTVIEDEILLLDNYIRLEKNALGHSLEYSISVDEAIDQTYERVPSIFLQPIVENAIKHGLRHKEGTKQLHIHFRLADEALCITVSDNGIGRTASAALNKFRVNHHSFAGNALEKRIEYLNEKAGYHKYKLTTEDLAEGTRVTLLIAPDEL